MSGLADEVASWPREKKLEMAREIVAGLNISLDSLVEQLKVNVAEADGMVPQVLMISETAMAILRQAEPLDLASMLAVAAFRLAGFETEVQRP